MTVSVSNRLRRSADYRRSAVSLRIYAAGSGRILSCLFAEGILFGSGASLVVVVKLLVSFEQRRGVIFPKRRRSRRAAAQGGSCKNQSPPDFSPAGLWQHEYIIDNCNYTLPALSVKSCSAQPNRAANRRGPRQCCDVVKCSANVTRSAG